MLDRLSLDQLRVLVTVVEEESFSAAGRRLSRSQSRISQTIAMLEDQVGFALFERTGRTPVLTPHGGQMLAAARRVLDNVDGFKRLADGLAGGVEAELSLVVDAMFPQEVLTQTVAELAVRFPHTALRLHVEALGAVAEMVVDGRCSVGLMGSLPVLPTSLEQEQLFGVELVCVAAPHHPIAGLPGPIGADQLKSLVQIVLSDRSKATERQDFGVVTALTWRVSDLGLKHALLLAACGWGRMPQHMVADDLEAGRLVEVDLIGPLIPALPMSAIWRRDDPPGVAARWLVAQLRSQRA